jgi:polyribonucleotide nucleotidyltransferase
MLGAVVFGHEQMQVAIAPSASWRRGRQAALGLEADAGDAALVQAVAKRVPTPLSEAYRITEKQQRSNAAERDQEEVHRGAERAMRRSGLQSRCDRHSSCSRLESRIVRERILAGEPRIDGRDMKTVRPITCGRACCHARTDRRCSRAARPRHW